MNKLNAHLTGLLDQALAYPITLVLIHTPTHVAMLHAWLQSCPCPTTWVTLDGECNNPIEFLKRLSLALETIQPGIRQLLPDLMSDTLANGMIDLINALTRVPGDFIFILDNYSAIDSIGIHDAVQLLLDYAPPQLHLILSARLEPPLSLARLTARRQLLRLALE